MEPGPLFLRAFQLILIGGRRRTRPRCNASSKGAIYTHSAHLSTLPNSTHPQDVFQTMGLSSTLLEELLRART